MVKKQLFKNNHRGFSLVELMVTLAVTMIVSFFTFDSIRSVIQTSMRVQRRADFNALADDIRYLTNRLDQCSCNFGGLSWPVATTGILFPAGSRLTRFSSPQTGLPCLANAAADTIVAEVGKERFNSHVDSLELKDIQFVPSMNILRANLKIKATTNQNDTAALKEVSREFPLMFSTVANAGTVMLQGCIGMTR